jgi:beta-barrel assembly-enhancing protease
MQSAGYWYDGQSAARHTVRIGLDMGAQTLQVQPEALAAFGWPLDLLRLVEVDLRGMTLTLHSDAGDEQPRDAQRLVVLEPALIAWLQANAPNLRKRDLPTGVWLRLLGWSAAALAAVAVILLVFLPRISDILANNLSLDREVAFGDAVVGQIESLLAMDMEADLSCTDPAGLAALEKLRARLVLGQGLHYDLRLRVFDHPMNNAFAAPGGQIVIIRGFLDQAESPEEVAGVLAHEIGHVEHRDTTRAAFRAAGSTGILSLMLGDVSGGTAIALLGNQLLSTSYSREAETAADAFGFDLMAKAKISTAGVADFFARIGAEDVAGREYISTHPSSGGREAAARVADQGAGAAILTDLEWRDLQGICGR